MRVHKRGWSTCSRETKNVSWKKKALLEEESCGGDEARVPVVKRSEWLRSEGNEEEGRGGGGGEKEEEEEKKEKEKKNRMESEKERWGGGRMKMRETVPQRVQHAVASKKMERRWEIKGTDRHERERERTIRTHNEL